MSMEKELEQFKLQAQMQLEQFKAQLEQDTALKIAHMNNETKLLQAEIAAKSQLTAQMDNAADAALNDDGSERV
ncbi:MAG: hypothetical protein KGI52_01825, partial [Burkholderiales bacterium]|nr:hypothetical protein [Burkholderiales bacterium]